MRAFWIAFALLCLVSPACAKERTKPKIAPLRDRASVTCRLNYASEWKAAKDMGVPLYPIEGQDVAKFMAIFNAAEPKTDFKAEQILIISTHEIAFIEMFKNGCVNHFVKVAPAAFQSLMEAAFGDGVTNGEWM
jgi:hypothetical protein